MKRISFFLAVLAVIVQGCGLFGGKTTGSRGELTGVLDRPTWDFYRPVGMVRIPAGSFHIGQNDQDVPNSQIAPRKQITIGAFLMDETEISNNQYRQFLYAVTGEGTADDSELYYDNQDSDEEIVPFQLDPNMTEDDIMPDSTVWTRDFAYAYNEPMMEYYFQHSAFDDYPVVGIDWYAAREFCRWRSSHLNNYRKERKLEKIPKFRLPSEAEWEYASRGGYEHKIYPWEGPYLRNSKGCFLANFKPGRGNYIDDNFAYTAPVDAYIPNDYGLYNMPGNVSEWCQDDFEEAAYTYVNDMNPLYKDPRYPKVDNERFPGFESTMREVPLPPLRKAVRGGSWKDIGYFLSNGSRSYEYADTAKAFIGFRCVVTEVGSSASRRY